MSPTSISTFLMISAGIALVTPATAAASEQSALHLWYEQQRSLTDGAAVPQSAPQPANGGRAAPSRVLQARQPGAPQAAMADCFVEQMKLSDGYIPAECRSGPHDDARWVVDEDKQFGRHFQGSRR